MEPYCFLLKNAQKRSYIECLCYAPLASKNNNESSQHLNCVGVFNLMFNCIFYLTLFQRTAQIMSSEHQELDGAEE